MTVTAVAVPAFNKSFERFLEFLRDQEVGTAALSPRRFSEVFGMDIQTLAAQAHVHRSLVQRGMSLTEGCISNEE